MPLVVIIIIITALAIVVTLHEKTRTKSRNDFLSDVDMTSFSSTLAIFIFFIFSKLL